MQSQTKKYITQHDKGPYTILARLDKRYFEKKVKNAKMHELYILYVKYTNHSSLIEKFEKNILHLQINLPTVYKILGLSDK